LSALLHRRNDFALRSSSGPLRRGHVVSLLRCILQHTYMSAEELQRTDSNHGS
jgi:hypothetical protein